jgi:alkylation response protein AidB-like acyl-CoA dehydrogenase
MIFSTEHQQLSGTVTPFVQRHIKPHLAAWGRTGMFPSHRQFKKRGDLALRCLNTPQEIGSAALKFSHCTVVAGAAARFSQAAQGAEGVEGAAAPVQQPQPQPQPQLQLQLQSPGALA